ncbi:hypothetical protein M2440_002224 [Methylorubrum extorquens]|nr:hypothetical protein [Methylorubrum extorquens]MDH6666003.1 hypothetical protein [Methylorubrum zatmanii]
MPLRQTDLTDAMGLTTVNISLVLKQIGDANLINFERRQLEIQNWQRLYEVAEFDPTYLHIKSFESWKENGHGSQNEGARTSGVTPIPASWPRPIERKDRDRHVPEMGAVWLTINHQPEPSGRKSPCYVLASG